MVSRNNLSPLFNSIQSRSVELLELRSTMRVALERDTTIDG